MGRVFIKGTLSREWYTGEGGKGVKGDKVHYDL